MSGAELAQLRRAWRADVPALERFIPLNHCSQAPPNRRTRAALDRYLTGWEETGMDWDGWIDEVEAARAAFARLVGANPQDIAIASSLSQLVSSIAGALDYPDERNEVLVDSEEFPTVSQIWSAQERRGAQVRAITADECHYDLDNLGLSERTAVVSLTHGVYANGTLRDLKPAISAARAVGAITIVDAYQSLGTRPFDVQDVGADVVASGCLKYLLGVPGLAFAYVRPELSERLQPVATGWFGRREPFAFSSKLDWADGARRLDMGTPPILEAYVCRAGIEWLLEVGLKCIMESTQVSSSALIDGGQALGLRLVGAQQVERRTPAVAFEVADSAQVEAGLRARGIVASARGDVIRLAPHFYTSTEDVERALAALGAVIDA